MAKYESRGDKRQRNHDLTVEFLKDIVAVCNKHQIAICALEDEYGQEQFIELEHMEHGNISVLKYVFPDDDNYIDDCIDYVY